MGSMRSVSPSRLQTRTHGRGNAGASASVGVAGVRDAVGEGGEVVGGSSGAAARVGEGAVVGVAVRVGAWVGEVTDVGASGAGEGAQAGRNVMRARRQRGRCSRGPCCTGDLIVILPSPFAEQLNPDWFSERARPAPGRSPPPPGRCAGAVQDWPEASRHRSARRRGPAERA